MREEFRDEMRDGEHSVEVDGKNFKMVMKRSLDGAERKTCDEKYDIRETSVKGNPFTPSAQGVLKREHAASEKPKVATNPDLHSDTTEPGMNTVTSQPYEKKLSKETEKNVVSDKMVPLAVKRKVFNS